MVPFGRAQGKLRLTMSGFFLTNLSNSAHPELVEGERLMSFYLIGE
jgi:hypothetical protein